jgi:hypothetical protein
MEGGEYRLKETRSATTAEKQILIHLSSIGEWYLIPVSICSINFLIPIFWLSSSKKGRYNNAHIKHVLSRRSNRVFA